MTAPGTVAMLIRPKLELPAVLRRALDAYRANDPITIAEAYRTDARLIMRLDEDVAKHLGFEGTEPIVATGGVGILRFYAYDMSTYDVQDVEIVSAERSGRNIAGICNWSLRLRETGETFLGTCNNTWTLDVTGRKIIGSHTVCGVYRRPAGKLQN